MNRITSVSVSVSSARATMRRFMRNLGLWIPGVSMKITCPRPGRVSTPRILLRVVCGTGETMATL